MKFIKLLLILFIIFTVILAAVIFGSGGRKALIEFALNHATKTSVYEITMEGLNTSSINNYSADKIVFDNKQNRIEIEKFNTDLNLTSLIKGEINVEDISANKVKWQKYTNNSKAVINEKPQETSAKQSSSSAKFMPVWIKKFTFNSIQFDNNGKNFNLGLNGNAKLTSARPEDIDINLVLNENKLSKKLLEIKTLKSANGEKQILLAHQDQAPLFLESFTGSNYFKSVNMAILTKIIETDGVVRFDLSDSAIKLDALNLGMRGAIIVDTNKNIVKLDKFLLLTGNSQQIINGEFSSSVSKGDVTLNQFPLSIANFFIKDKIEGQANGQVAFAVEGKKISANGNVELNSRLYDKPLAAATKFNLADNIATIGSLGVNYEGSTLAAAGKYQLDKQVADIQAKLNNFPMGLIKKFAPSVPKELDGNVSFNGSIKGNVKDPEISGTAGFAGNYANIPVKLEAEGARKGEEVIVKKLEVRSSDNSNLSASGTLTKDKFDFSTVANAIPLKILQAFGVNIPDTLFSSNLKISGNVERPVINGQVNIASKQMGKNFTLASDIKTEGNNISLNGIIKDAANNLGNFNIVTTNNFYRKDGFKIDELTAKGNAELKALMAVLGFDKQFSLTGSLAFNANVKDVPAANKVNGSVSIKNGSFYYPDSGTNLTAININLVSDGKIVSFKDSSAKDASGGNVAFTGDVKLNDDFKKSIIDLAVSVDKLHAVQIKEVDAYASGKLALSGDFNKMLAKGAFDINPIKFYPPDLDLSRISGFGGGNKSAPKANVKTAAKPATPSPLELDIDATIKKGAGSIDSRYAKGNLSGKININGNAAEPNYGGNLLVDNGVINVIGKTFNITQGKVDIVNKQVFLDIIAEYQMKERKIIASVKGTKEAPSVSLASDPPGQLDSIMAIMNGGNLGNVVGGLVGGSAAGNNSGKNGLDVGGLLNSLGKKKKNNAEPASSPASAPASVPASIPVTVTPQATPVSAAPVTPTEAAPANNNVPASMASPQAEPANAAPQSNAAPVDNGASAIPASQQQ